MRKSTIRFPDWFHGLLENEARASGSSVANVIREGALARVLWGRLLRGESVYADAYQGATRILAGSAPPSQAGELSGAVEAVLEHAPRALNEILRALDGAAPDAGRWIRHVYGVPPGRFAPEGSTATENEPRRGP